MGVANDDTTFEDLVRAAAGSNVTIVLSNGPPTTGIVESFGSDVVVLKMAAPREFVAVRLANIIAIHRQSPH
ncbi:MAG: hypothetical protein ABSC94_18330 [Polyangiaceae bacterium]|jgi:sRNA-binding regulator protein Hfq